MESSLRSLSGPRIKYTPDASPYESITVDKLTPIIGGEIGGVDLCAPSNRQMDEIHRALAENLVIFFRDSTCHRNSTWISGANSASCTSIRRRRPSRRTPS